MSMLQEQVSIPPCVVVEWEMMKSIQNQLFRFGVGECTKTSIEVFFSAGILGTTQLRIIESFGNGAISRATTWLTVH